MEHDDTIDDAWSFDLPSDRIARYPASRRSDARLLHLPLDADTCVDRHVHDLPSLLRPGDLLVVNDSRVLPARLVGRRATGGKVELLLLGVGPGPIEALARPARKLREGAVITLDAGVTATVVREAVGGIVQVVLSRDPIEVMEEMGALPLPPYLNRAEEPSDRERYQTVYADTPGSAAAPTAGLHFTDELLARLAAAGVGLARVTLHVGLGTFRPLRPEDLAAGRLHAEWREVPEATVDAIAATRERGGRVIAVGTTSVRSLESATPEGTRIPSPCRGATDLFLRPPYAMRTVDGLLTNFHLPGSSLVMLVACLVGRERLLSTYATAVDRGYRFYSYGDAMLLL